MNNEPVLKSDLVRVFLGIANILESKLLLNEVGNNEVSHPSRREKLMALAFRKMAENIEDDNPYWEDKFLLEDWRTR